MVSTLTLNELLENHQPTKHIPTITGFMIKHLLENHRPAATNIYIQTIQQHKTNQRREKSLNGQEIIKVGICFA